MSDPTAAERARRYRARRRDITATFGSTGSAVELLSSLVDEVHKLAESVDKLADRDASRADRDVTSRHAASTDAGPYAGAVTDAATPPTAASGGVPSSRDAVTALRVAELHGRLLGLLDGHSPHTVAAIADALDLGQRAALEALIELQSLSLVRRVAGTTPAERDRWERVSSPLVEALDRGFDDRGLHA